MSTTVDNIHPDIIQTHILTRLDGQSLSTTATISSCLKNLCSDSNLWSQISRSTWPSITHPRLDDVISTFPSGHRSFFDDSFPNLVADVSRRNPRRSWSAPKTDCSGCNLDRSSCSWPSELISAVDIRYRNDIVYSNVNFANITPDFLSSPFGIELSDPTRTRPGSDLTSNRLVSESVDSQPGFDPTRNRSEFGTEHVNGFSRWIDLMVDEIAGADKATLSLLKESVTLNWILIDPIRKRACNLSSIKPVSARQDWVSNETLIRFVTVLPGCEPNEVVKCRINVVLGVGEKGVGLYVKEVGLKLKDLDSISLNGLEFLRVIEGAKNVKRKVVVGDDERWKGYKVFKMMKRDKKLWEQKEERKKELVIHFNYVAIFVSFFLSLYFGYLLVKK